MTVIGHQFVTLSTYVYSTVGARHCFARGSVSGTGDLFENRDAFRLLVCIFKPAVNLWTGLAKLSKIRLPITSTFGQCRN